MDQELNPDNSEYGAEVLIAKVPHFNSLCVMTEVLWTVNLKGCERKLLLPVAEVQSQVLLECLWTILMMTSWGWIRIKIQAFISKNGLWKILMWSTCILIRIQIQTFMKWSRSTRCVILHRIRWKVLPKLYNYVLYLVTWCPLLGRLFVNFSAFNFVLRDKMQITGRLRKPVFLNIWGMFCRFLTSIPISTCLSTCVR